MRRSGVLFLSLLGVLLLLKEVPLYGAAADGAFLAAQAQKVQDWRKERDVFFKTHQRSPLTPDQKKHFKGLSYYPFDPKVVFSGSIQRYILNINNPQYYATFLTNKGTSKRYIRYGKFHFRIDGKDSFLEVFKSILGDNLFIPFKDGTNGKETYEAGRYIETEILAGYQMVLDFNTSYFPSCAYNDKFVCALPPNENRLNIEIRAGEKNVKP
jgi:hypothetical protein